MSDYMVDMMKKAEWRFVAQYKETSEAVRAEYIRLLEANSRQDQFMHGVHVDGYNALKRHHWGLKPESYAMCVPTDRVKSAFEVIGARCHIDDEPHFEVWGN